MANRGPGPAVLDDTKPGVTLGGEHPAAQGHLAPAGHPILHRLVDRLAELSEAIHRWQLIEAQKQPDDFITRRNVVVPDLTQANGAVPVELSAKRNNRNTIVISNTGDLAIYVGNSSRDCIDNGFTVAAGGVLEIEARNAVWAWAVAVEDVTTSTVDTLETLYGVPTLDKDHRA